MVFSVTNPRHSITSKNSFSSQKAEAAKHKSDWRKKHEDFIQSLQAARTVTDAMKRGKTITLTMNYELIYRNCV